MAEAVNEEIAKISNVLDSVPMKPGVEPPANFLNIYKLTFKDIKSMNLNETKWDQLHPVPVNKLLKLGISFGNLIKSFLIEMVAYETKQNNEKNMRKGVDPVGDHSSKFQVPTPHVNFTRNFLVILKNYDIGSDKELDTKYSRNSRSLGTIDTETQSSIVLSGTTNNSSSLIRLSTRQLLIEKLEINIRLDALFTMKIVLKLLVTMFTIIRALVDTYADDVSELSAIRAYSENLSIFSSNSSASGNTETINSMDDYVRLIKDTTTRVNLGLIEPLYNMLLSEIVEPRVIASFQNLANNI